MDIMERGIYALIASGDRIKARRSLRILRILGGRIDGTRSCA